MKTLEILFGICLFIVFYTYLGYGMLLYVLVRIKEWLAPPAPAAASEDEEWPDITLLVAAYNEEEVVDEKMQNTRSLDYPEGKLKTMWVTDGSNDGTNRKLAAYPEVRILYQPERQGKTAALNRAVEHVETPLVVFTDANTLLNREAIREIVKAFRDKTVGCVAGEKRIAVKEKANAASGGEGIYWKYESALKRLDGRLYSAMGAAGELFAIRTELFEKMEPDTLLDDFILSLRIVQRGYRIAYCSTAYAVEGGSADMREEEKRKVRIAAGGLQSVWRLRTLLNPFRYGVVSFQYISHRVLRWSVTPLALFALLPLNIAIVMGTGSRFYLVLLCLQGLFYAMGTGGYLLSTRHIKSKLLYIPYYFLFMNLNVIKGIFYLRRKRGSGAWEKSKRA